jgi:ElaB/YqjD/DUF883 family membrane-anchored ribosome-binding protein
MSQSPNEPRTPEEIRADIEETRDELADTVAALAYKADVKARAADRVQEVKADVRERVDELKSTVAEKAPESAGDAISAAGSTARSNPVPSAAVAAALIGFAIGYLIARRRA